MLRSQEPSSSPSSSVDVAAFPLRSGSVPKIPSSRADLLRLGGTTIPSTANNNNNNNNNNSNNNGYCNFGTEKDEGEKAKDMWNMLDDLRDYDPTEYARFVRGTMAEAAAVAAARESHSPAPTPPPSSVTIIRPREGFVIVATARRPCRRTCLRRPFNDEGEGRRESLTSTKEESEVQLFLNICSHHSVRRPTRLSSGQVVDMERNEDGSNDNCRHHFWSGVEIPMVLSKLRSVEHDGDKGRGGGANENLAAAPAVPVPPPSLVVDVILHPSCVDRCRQDTYFKNELMRLALTSVGAERGLTVEASSSSSLTSWMDVPSTKYKGGCFVGRSGKATTAKKKEVRNNNAVLTIPLVVGGDAATAGWDGRTNDRGRGRTEKGGGEGLKEEKDRTRIFTDSDESKAVGAWSDHRNPAEDDEYDGGGGAGGGGIVAGDPTELLCRMRRFAEKDEEEEFDGDDEKGRHKKPGGRRLHLFTNPERARVATAAARSPLIRDVSSTDDGAKANEGGRRRSQPKHRPSLKDQMRGFLDRKGGKGRRGSGDNGRTQTRLLYGDGGSTGDGTAGTGGAYAKIMSRCTVVELTSSIGAPAAADTAGGDKGGALELRERAAASYGVALHSPVRRRALDDLGDVEVSSSKEISTGESPISWMKVSPIDENGHDDRKGDEDDGKSSETSIDAESHAYTENVDSNLRHSFVDLTKINALIRSGNDAVLDRYDEKMIEEDLEALSRASKAEKMEGGGEEGTNREPTIKEANDQGGEKKLNGSLPDIKGSCPALVDGRKGLRRQDLPYSVSISNREKKITIEIDLSRCDDTNEELDALELEVSNRFLKLKTLSGWSMSHVFDDQIDLSGVSARLKKRRRRLQVVAPLC